MKLEEVCELIVDTEHKTAPNTSSGIPSIRTPNVGKGRLILDKDIKYVDEQTYSIWTKRAIPQKDDLIIAREAPVGNVAIVPDVQLCLGQRTVLIRPDHTKVYPSFLCYFLLSPKIQNRMIAGSGGSTVSHLNMKDIRNLDVKEIPELKIQQKIGSILSTYDDLIENNLMRIKLLEEASRLEYLLLLKSKTEFNEYFIDDVCDTVGGGTPSTKEIRYWEDGEITWFSPTDLTRHNCIVLLDSEKKITALGLEKSSAKLLPPKAILMTSRATIGYFGLINKAVCTNQGFISIVPFKEHYRTYMLFNLMSRKEEIIGNANGATYLEITKGNFRKMKIKIPKNEKSLEALETSFVLKFNLIENLLKQNTKLREARDILLPRLMSGEIEV